MSIVDDLLENLIERNVIKLNATLKVSLVSGGVRVRGQLSSTLRDQKKNKDVLKAEVPVDTSVKVGEIVIPLPQLK